MAVPNTNNITKVSTARNKEIIVPDRQAMRPTNSRVLFLATGCDPQQPAQSRGATFARHRPIADSNAGVVDRNRYPTIFGQLAKTMIKSAPPQAHSIIPAVAGFARLYLIGCMARFIVNRFALLIIQHAPMAGHNNFDPPSSCAINCVYHLVF